MKIVEGDPAELRMGFDPFFHVHFERVAKAAALVTRNAGAGQDLAQESFTRLLDRWADMVQDDHARNFVYKVAINLARSPSAQARACLPLPVARPGRPGRSSLMDATEG